jgi:xylono-1,5-lactonase
MDTIRIIARDNRDQLGEGPVWLAADNALAWVDIMAPAVHRMDLASGAITTLAMPEPIGWIIPRAHHSDWIAGFKSGFARFDPHSGAISPIGNPEPERTDNRLNDAKVDRWGRIWAGSKDDSDKRTPGALYRLDTDYNWTRMDDGYGVTNGPTFSLDGHTLYHTDSAGRTIYAFDLGADGSLSNKRIWKCFPADWGYPDGMTTDAEGCLWVAHWDGARISRFAPDGGLIRAIALPASNITSCAFAGPRLDRLFITSSSVDHADEPHAGALFEIDPGVCGMPQGLFAG